MKGRFCCLERKGVHKPQKPWGDKKSSGDIERGKRANIAIGTYSQWYLEERKILVLV
jgi:hypothetical protein